MASLSGGLDALATPNYRNDAMDFITFGCGYAALK